MYVYIYILYDILGPPHTHPPIYINNPTIKLYIARYFHHFIILAACYNCHMGPALFSYPISGCHVDVYYHA